MNANGPVQPGVPPRPGGGGAPAPSPDDTLADLVRDRAVVVAALLDAGSGMLLTSRSRDGAPEDLETVCAGQADVIRAALDAARVSIGGPAPTEVVVAHGDRLHQLLRTVHDPLGDRLVLSLLVDGPPRALRRVRRRLGRIDAAALVPLPHRGPGAGQAPPSAPPAPMGADLFTPAHPGAQGPWWAGDGVRADPADPAHAPWSGFPPAPPGAVPAPAGAGPAGFSADVIDSAIEETVRIAAHSPMPDGVPAPAPGGVPVPAPPATQPAAVRPPAPAAVPAVADPEPVTTALPVVTTGPGTPPAPAAAPATVQTISVSLGPNPAALPARPGGAPTTTAPVEPPTPPGPATSRPVTPRPGAAVTPAVAPTPATPVAMPAVPSRPVPAAAVLVSGPAGVPAIPVAMPVTTPAAEPPAPEPPAAGTPARPGADARSAAWSRASVLGHGAGPGGAPTATDVVAALDRVGPDDSLSGSALFTGVVPAEPPPPVDDPPPPMWDAGPPPGPAPSTVPPQAPPVPAPHAGVPVDGSDPHPWFGGRHARPAGEPAAAPALPGPGRHTTTTGTPVAAPVAPAPPAPGPPSAVHPVPAQARPADVAAPATLHAAMAAPASGWSLFEPAPRAGTRAETDVSALAERADSTPVDLGEQRHVPQARPPGDDAAGEQDGAGRDGGNRVDPGR